MKCSRRLNGASKTIRYKAVYVVLWLIFLGIHPASGKKFTIEKKNVPQKAFVYLGIYNAHDTSASLHLVCTAPDFERDIKIPASRYTFVPLSRELISSKISCELTGESPFPEEEDQIFLLFLSEEHGLEKEVLFPSEPRILGVTPSVLDTHQSVSITMNVRGFKDGCEVRGNGSALPILQRSGNHLTVMIPESTWPAWSLQIVCEEGKKSNAVPLQVRIPLPEITRVDWNFTMKGEIVLDIQGQGFSKDVKVVLNRKPLQSQYISTTRLQAWTDGLAPGLYVLQVLTPDGSMSRPFSLQLNWEPLIQTIQPKLVEPYTPFNLTLSGRMFTPSLTCRIGDLVFPVHFQSSNLIQVQVPGLAPGEYLVILQMDTLQFPSNHYVIVNAKPRIERIRFFPNPAVRLARVTIEALAIDPEGDSLSYTWSIVQGPVASSHPDGQRFEINLSNETGQLVVRLEVKDSAGNRVSRLVRIPVVW